VVAWGTKQKRIKVAARTINRVSENNNGAQKQQQSTYHGKSLRSTGKNNEASGKNNEASGKNN